MATWRNLICGLGMLCLLLVQTPNNGQIAQDQASVPDLSGLWAHGPLDEFEPLPGEPAPVGDRRGPLRFDFIFVAYQPDYNNPNLKPWASAYLRAINNVANASDLKKTDNPQESCRPSGVPNVILLPAPIQILQMENQVTILYQRDHQVRQIYLNEEHSENPPLTPYGESVGYYDGDTLVIETIGMTDDTPLDLFSTPHTSEMKVIERVRRIPSIVRRGILEERLEWRFTVDDPQTFYEPWTSRMIYTRVRGDQTVLREEVCAENNRLPRGNYGVPHAGPNEYRY